MTAERLPANDPRTIARDIPGILDSLFPQLVPGVVAHFNRQSYASRGCKPVPQEIVIASSLQRAMLFELAVAAAEELLAGRNENNWEHCLSVAAKRQRRHFDARIPEFLSAADKTAALAVASNLAFMLEELKDQIPSNMIVTSPPIPGFRWVASGVGDFSVATTLIEVKCTQKHFSSSDYRQIVMYWLLSYAAAIETGASEWSEGILINPRLNLILRLPFGELIDVTGAGRSKIELLQIFSAMIGDSNNGSSLQ